MDRGDKMWCALQEFSNELSKKRHELNKLVIQKSNCANWRKVNNLPSIKIGD